jgi:predicted AlkP superfamily phosphohydrolase/phosphomutase
VRRVIVIGLDGFDPSIVESMLDAGELPNLERLRGEGGYGRVRTTYPALTPVAWSTFATGMNPGGHGIFDFVRRDPNTYLLDLSLNRHEQKRAYLPPKAVNLRRGETLWELLSAAGIPSTVLRLPCTYPPDDIRGRMLSGMGVPDVRGGLGTSTYYTSDHQVKAGENENVVRLPQGANGAITTHLIGPRDPRTGEDFTTAITLHLEHSACKVVVRSDGRPDLLEVREGEWSDWLRIKFRTGLLQSVRGMVRFYVVRMAPSLELYASPVNFDPVSPLFPISSPPEYAKELAEKVGTFYTTGMVEDHGGLDNRRFGEAAYLEQCEGILRERERMMLYELERFRDGLFFCLFDTPDRVQHMFWRFRERGHPAVRGDEPPWMARVIDGHYRACDAIVGKALQYADDETLVIVLSDHGMSGFRRGVHLNTWLYENGLLALKRGVEPGVEAGDFFRNVDWNRTRAYALGLGGIYLNLGGREAQGIVGAEEAAALKVAIAKGLTGLADPGRRAVVVRSVLAREQVYAGPYAHESPDLVVNFSEGYRVSWATALGGVPAGQFQDNERKWSGDHTIDPVLVPGVLFMNRVFRAAGADLLDLAPTVLSALGAPKGVSMEGESLLG